VQVVSSGILAVPGTTLTLVTDQGKLFDVPDTFTPSPSTFGNLL
jgi:hypothetical protein